MGSGSSQQMHQPEMLTDHHQQFVDVGMLFKGIPKMMQVADDMHRMTDYIMDLRNMTLALVAISLVGVLGFLLLRAIHGRSNKSRRKRSLTRYAEEGYPGMSQYQNYYRSQFVPEPWDRPKSTFSLSQNDEMKKPAESRGSNSPETRGVPNGSLPFKPGFEEVSPDGEKKTSPAKDVPAYRQPPGSQKLQRTPPIIIQELLADDLPFADS